MKGFDTPILLHELGREPIQQFGVRGTLTLEAEVARVRGNALVKMMLPDSVHENARGERIPGIREQTRQGGTSTGAV